MLILYPNTGYDAFVSVVDCDAFLALNVIGAQRESYGLLSDTDKEIYIRQATLSIKNSVTLPNTLENDLMRATAYLVNYSIGKDMTNSDRSSNIKSKEISGVTKTEYFTANSDVNSFPDICQSLLKQYDVVTDGTFSFNRS